MAAEVFFDSFHVITHLSLNDCFKIQPVLNRAKVATNQWQSWYQVYIQKAQFMIMNDAPENILENILSKHWGTLEQLTLRKCNLQENFFTHSFFLKKDQCKIKQLDLSKNPLNIDGTKSILKFFVDTNCHTLETLKLSGISEFVYMQDEFTALLIQILSKLSPTLRHLDLSSNRLGDSCAFKLLNQLAYFEQLHSLSLANNQLTDKFWNCRSMFGGFAQLKELRLGRNSFVEQEKLMEQREMIGKLERLDIRSCFGMLGSTHQKENVFSNYNNLIKERVDITNSLIKINPKLRVII